MNARCEVMQEDEGYFGAWFAGVVRGHKPPSKVTIEYDELLEGDDEDPDAPLTQLQSDEHVRKIRPVAPVVADRTAWVNGIQVHHMLQLFYIGGWWDVQVLAVDPQGPEGTVYTVKSLNYEAEHLVKIEDLRPVPNFVWDLKSKSWMHKENQAQKLLEQASSPSAASPAAASPAAASASDGVDDEVLEAEQDIEVDVEFDPMDQN